MDVVIGKVLSATSQKMERGRIAAWFGDIVGGDCEVVVDGLKMSTSTRGIYLGGEPHRRWLAGSGSVPKLVVAVGNQQPKMPCGRQTLR